MIQSTKRNPIKHLALLCCLILFGAKAKADQPWATSVDGRLFQTGTSNPLKDSTLTFTLQVLNPAKDCVLYEETQIYDTNITNGYFSLKVGSALPDLSGRRTSNDPGYSMARIFNNTLNSFPVAAGCAGGYSPANGDTRYLRVAIQPTSGSSETLAPDIALNSVPSAKVAETVGGLTRAELLQVNTSGVNRVDQNNLQAVFNTTQLPILTALLGGTSSLYMRQGANGAATLPGVSGNASSATAGQIWYDTATNTMKYQSNLGPQTLGVSGAGITAVTAGTGLNVGAGPGGSITTSGTLNIDVGSGVGQIVQVQTGGKLPALSGADLTNLNGSAVNSGTIGGTTAMNTSGTIQSGAITSSGAIAGASVSATGAVSGANVAATGAITAATLTTTGSVSSSDVRTNSVKIFRPSTLNHVELIADATLSSSLVFTLPTTLGSNGQVLQVDNTGKMSWTTITGVTPGGSAGGDLGGTYPNPDVVKIRGNTVATGTLVAGDAGKIYRWSGTQFEAVNFGIDDLKTEAGLSQFATNCNSNQTLTWSTITDAFSCTPISINANQVTAGTVDAARLPVVGVDKGGTGLSALGLANQVLGVNAAGNATEYKAITGGAGVTVSHSAGGIQISAPGTGGTVTNVSGAGPISVATGTTTPAISISQATTSTDGYLSSTDWTTFNNKQTAGSYITALTGDVVATGPGSSSSTIQANAVTTGKINDGAVTTNKLGALSVTDAKINDVAWGKLTGKPTSLSGYGITDQLVTNGGGTPSILSATEALRPAAGTAGRLFFATDTFRVFRDTGSVWEQMSVNASDLSAGTLPSARLPAFTGDVTSSAGTSALTLATVPLSKGGTGLTAGGTGNQVLGMNNLGTAAEYKNIIGGSGVTITPSVGALTITATGSGGTVTSVSGSGPISVATGTTTPAISITQASTSTNGFLSSTDWNTFNGKVDTAALSSYVLKAGDTMSGALAISSNTASSSAGTGALTIAGGVGIGGNINTTGSISTTGAISSGTSDITGNNIRAGYGSSVANFASESNKAMTFTPDGTERMRIAVGGNVGIGTNSPGEKLEVLGNVKATQLCIGSDCRGAWPSAGGSSANIASKFGLDPAIWPDAIQCGAGSDKSLFTLRFVYSGTVQYWEDTGYYVLFNTNGTYNAAIGASALVDGCTSKTMATIATEGRGLYYGSQPQSQWVDGTSAAPGVSFTGDADTGFYRPGSNILAASTGGTERLRIDAVGNVGIGTTGPSEKLDVAGKIKGTELCIGADCRSAWPTGSAGTVTQVTSANADIGVATTTTTPVLTLNSGIGANQILKLNGSSEIPAVSGVNLTNLNATNLASGTLPAARLPAFTGDVTSSAGSAALTLGTVPVSKGGTGLTSFGISKVLASNGSGSGLINLSCAPGEMIKFDSSGFVGCDTIANVLGYTPANGTNYVAKTGSTMTGALVLPSNGLAVGTNQLVVSGGNVGIGTATTSSKLSILDGDIRLTKTDGTTYNALTFYEGATARGFVGVSRTAGTGLVSGGSANSLVLRTENADIHFNTNAGTSAAMTVAASGNVGIGTASPSASSILELSSTTAGFLPPRMTQIQRDAVTQVAGLVVYNTTSGRHEYSNGTTWQIIGAAASSVSPAGMVGSFSMATCPTGWLEANGSAISRTTYPGLFTALGTAYGAGDGSTTFNLPDYRGYFLRGRDGGAAVDPDRATRTNRGDGTTGDNVGTKQVDQLKSHDHSYAVGANAGILAVTGGSGTYYYTNAGATSGATGGAESRPKNISVIYCVSTAAITATTTASSGSGTVNFVPQWTSSTALGDSPIAINGTNVGIGTTSAGQKLTVAGTVESTSGGFRFPDSTTQATAAFGPTFSANCSSNCSGASASGSTFVKVPLNTIELDTNSSFNTTTNRFVPNKAGYYRVNADLTITLVGTGGFTIYGAIYKNGIANRVNNQLINYTGSFTQTVPVSTIVYMNGTTDYLEAYFTTNSGTATVGYGAMFGHYIRP